MKSSRLLKVFEDYIKKIDMNNAYAKAKYFHSLKSMDLARNIASELDFVINILCVMTNNNKYN